MNGVLLAGRSGHTIDGCYLEFRAHVVRDKTTEALSWARLGLELIGETPAACRHSQAVEFTEYIRLHTPVETSRYRFLGWKQY